jgi:O-antigen/teichoic acid export membrane protein
VPVAPAPPAAPAFAATPKLARLAIGPDPKGFLRLAGKLGATALALGVAAVAGAALLGGFVLTVAYRPEYAAYSGLLNAVMAAAIPGYVAVALGYAVTAARAFDAQVPLFCLAAATCGAASWLLVPQFGLGGAAMALAVSAAAQIGGQAFILRGALRRMETAG